jgi:hypothetical protein
MGILATVFMVLLGTNATAQDSHDVRSFTVKVTYMTQGGTKKTDNIAILAMDPSEAEREAEAQFKKKNPRSTFIRAESEFTQTESVIVIEKSRNLNNASPNTAGPSRFTVNVTYMTQGGTKKIDNIVVLAADPREAEQEAETQFKKQNPRSTFIRASAEN